jgi:toxin ParE1/3/4
MIREIRILPEAEEELLDHSTYLREHNPQKADRFLDEFESSCRKLAQFPHLGRLWSSNNEQLVQVRCWVITRFPKFMIYYRINEPDEYIEVISIRHSSQEVGDLFKYL